jgi:hypothetical protein
VYLLKLFTEKSVLKYGSVKVRYWQREILTLIS